jgi:ketosteroid isomerase-like protein
MKMKFTEQFLVLVVVLSFACSEENQDGSTEKWKNEIAKAEQEFADMADKEGIPKAFLAFAAEDVVVKRGKKLIIGIEALKESYEANSPSSGTVSLTWKPDFVDVSSSGDLGYTYGKYIYTQIDSSGISQMDSGVFHTVWKRQTDGKWKFVWD